MTARLIPTYRKLTSVQKEFCSVRETRPVKSQYVYHLDLKDALFVTIAFEDELALFPAVRVILELLQNARDDTNSRCGIYVTVFPLSISESHETSQKSKNSALSIGLLVQE